MHDRRRVEHDGGAIPEGLRHRPQSWKINDGFYASLLRGTWQEARRDNLETKIDEAYQVFSAALKEMRLAFPKSVEHGVEDRRDLLPCGVGLIGLSDEQPRFAQSPEEQVRQRSNRLLLQ